MIIALAFTLTGCDNEEFLNDIDDIDSDHDVELTIAGGAVGMEKETTEAAAAMYMERNPNVKVNVIESNDLAEDRLSFYLENLNNESSEIDLYQIDIVWPGDLGEHFLDLNDYGGESAANIHFEEIIDNNTVDGKLVALPWFTDVGLLYYRTDLLEKYDREVPETWDELEDTARYIMEEERTAGNKDFYGYVWQGDAYEGLTCNALEWTYSNDGGEIIKDNGEVTINNNQAVEIIKQAAGWVGDISPTGVTGMAEEDARSMFESGNALFMRHWPYAYALAAEEDKETAGNFNVAPLPAGDRVKSAGTLGGWNLGVSKYSDHPEEAAKLAIFMTGEEVQKMRALEAGFNPTIESLYDDSEIEEDPLYSELYDALRNAVARPSTAAAPNYGELSKTFYEAVHSVLTGDKDASTALNSLEQDLESIIE